MFTHNVTHNLLRNLSLAIVATAVFFGLSSCENSSSDILSSEGDPEGRGMVATDHNPGHGGGGGGGGGSGGGGGETEPPNVTKPVSFSILEDYDKGDPVSELEADFALFNELGIDTWRGSFGWDDYEPQQDQFDTGWLDTFATTAANFGIKLRPYIAYTAPWAGIGGSDGVYWNDPPADINDWIDFVGTIAAQMSQHSNVLSYEFYNEENDEFWWEGTVTQYNDVLREGAIAARNAHPGAEILFGGLVWPEFEWIDETCNIHQNAPNFDIASHHEYPETWSRNNIVVENTLDDQYFDWWVPTINNDCEAEPLWINETGFAAPFDGSTEQDQAEWWVRAFATFLGADGEIEHLGIYEIKDLPQGSDVIGGDANFHLGLTYSDRTKKLAFHTVKMLISLFDVGSLTVAWQELSSTEVAGSKSANDYYEHLFKRPDGAQIVIAYDKKNDVTVDLTVTDAGSSATEYALDGTSSTYGSFDGTTLSGVALANGTPRVFLINP